MDDKKLKTVPLNKIKISDQFWNRYIHLVKDVLIPYQWDILNDRLPDVETSHCIENFKIAAGETDGDFEGGSIPGYRCGEMAGSGSLFTGSRAG